MMLAAIYNNISDTVSDAISDNAVQRYG